MCISVIVVCACEKGIWLKRNRYGRVVGVFQDCLSHLIGQERE